MEVKSCMFNKISGVAILDPVMCWKYNLIPSDDDDDDDDITIRVTSWWSHSLRDVLGGL
jgi:hypothetical protein